MARVHRAEVGRSGARQTAITVGSCLEGAWSRTGCPAHPSAHVRAREFPTNATTFTSSQARQPGTCTSRPKPVNIAVVGPGFGWRPGASCQAVHPPSRFAGVSPRLRQSDRAVRISARSQAGRAPWRCWSDRDRGRVGCSGGHKACSACRPYRESSRRS